MPVAKDSSTGRMGQDSKAQKPNGNLIRRVKTRIGRSKRGTYSFHEPSQTYGDISPSPTPSPDTQPGTRDDYYNVAPGGMQSDMNGFVGRRKTPSKRTSVQSRSSTDKGNKKMNGASCEPINGFHHMDSISDPEDFESLRRGGSKVCADDNDCVKRGAGSLENGVSLSQDDSVPEEKIAPAHENDSVPGENSAATTEDYSTPGKDVAEPSGEYSVPGNDALVPAENGVDFEKQGAKPKVHYSKGKNGLRDHAGAAASTKRQAIRVSQEKAAAVTPRQDYLNVDLDDNNKVIIEEDSTDTHMSWQTTSADDDDDIREALKGPVLPPLILPPTSPGSPPNAPKTPHIELVFRKDDLIDEEFAFASRAVGFKIDPAVVPRRVPSTIADSVGTESASNRISRESGEDPSEAGLLLMSEQAVSQHRKEASASGGDISSTDTYGAAATLDIDTTRGASGPPPLVDRTSKPAVESTPEGVINDVDVTDQDTTETRPDPPPPVPPRLPTRAEDNEPTHEAIDYFKPDPNTRPKSLSLPRGTPNGFYDQQEQEPTTSDRVPRRRVISSFFHKKSSKRHSTFSERPLPAIPALQPGRYPANVSRQRAATLGADRRLPLPPAASSATLPPPPPPPPVPPPPGDYEGDEPDELPPAPPPKVPIKSPREIAEVQQILRARGEFASSLRKISDFGWYWGPMSWDDAETRLENTPDGSFLVRDSSDERHILSLSFRANGTTHHTRIEHQHGKFSFWSQPTSHGSTSVVDFIEEAMKHSHNGSFLYFLRPRMPGLPPAPVQLLYAISRFQKARSLQHMCRFVIRKNIRLDHIDQLPLPKRLKSYLAEAHYYTPEALEP